jgi:hypothetical protein
MFGRELNEAYQEDVASSCRMRPASVEQEMRASSVNDNRFAGAGQRGWQWHLGQGIEAKGILHLISGSRALTLFRAPAMASRQQAAARLP